VKNGNNVNFSEFNASHNTNLECIEVDDVAWSTANWTYIDGTSSFSTNCHFYDTYVPDDNFEQALIDLGYDTAPLDDYVLTANIITITDLDVHSKNIADLTGIESFTALTYLDCSSNALNNLNVSLNTALTTLYCNNNILSSLNVKNGNNVNFENFNATNNPNLDCINVDDEIWSATNWSGNVDNITVFSEDCNALSVDEFSVSEFIMYPNPAKDLLHIKLDASANYIVINIHGQIIKKGKLNKGENKLNVSTLSNGIYFFKIKTDDGLMTKKLVKQ